MAVGSAEVNDPYPALPPRVRINHPLHDVIARYNGGGCPASYVMMVSANGQVSIPAEARARWHADQVIVVDLGDRVVMRPLPDNPVADLRGKYRARGPNPERARQQVRSDEAATERRR